MAKVIDITDKLSFGENPSLMIKGEKIEVNGDAPTMLKIRGLMNDEKMESKNVLQAYELIFPKKSRNILDKLHLSFQDLMTVIQEAVELISGDVDSLGE